MAAHASNLSSSMTDMVIAVSEGGINTVVNGYLQQLSSSAQNTPNKTGLIVLAGANGPLAPMSLAQFLDQGGYNPFLIPSGTGTDNEQVSLLQEMGFLYGIQVQVGLPPGIAPAALYPPVVSLTKGASQVGLNMYFSEFTVVQFELIKNKSFLIAVPQSDPTHPWYVQTQVSLSKRSLGSDLDIAYFQAYPDKKAAIQSRLAKLSSNATPVLTQIFPDLTVANLSQALTIQGMDGSSVKSLVQSYLEQVFEMGADQLDALPLAFSATLQNATGTNPIPTIVPTSYESVVGPFLDSNGKPIDPSALTPDQEDAITLDVIGNVNSTPPPVAPFNWNWLSVADAQQADGIIAIRKNLFIITTLPALEEIAANYCLQPTMTASDMDSQGNWKLAATFAPSTTPVTVAPYDWNDVPEWREVRSANAVVLRVDTVAGIYVQCNGRITREANVMGAVSEIDIYLVSGSTGEKCLIYSAVFTVDYALTVTEDGDLEVATPTVTSTGGPISPTPTLSYINTTSIGSVATSADAAMKSVALTNLSQLQATMAQNFCFPGGNVFAFKNAYFSDVGDLICDITFLDPSTSQSTRGQIRSSPDEERKQLTTKDPTAEVGGALPLRPVGDGLKTTDPGPKDLKHTDGDKVSDAGTTRTLTYTTSLIENRLKGQNVLPPTVFEALQTADGLGLLFLLDSSDLMAIMELNGTSEYSCASYDLSTALIRASFPSDPNAMVRTFAAGQSVLDKSIGVAMAVTSGKSDNLFVSLGNSSSDTAWLGSPTWKAYPFDAEDGNGNKIDMNTLEIYGITFTETFQISPRFPKQQFLIVDINRSPQGPSTDIARYYIDWHSTDGPFWVEHDVAFDIEGANYQTCAGRASGEVVDGLYTMGIAGNASQLDYAPLVNDLGSGPPLVRKLWLRTPNVSDPISAIASARNDDSNNKITLGTTDLYAVGTTTLYCFAASGQGNGSCASELMTNDLFSGCTKLCAMTVTDPTIPSSTTILWGLNADQQVFYLSCPTSEVSQPASWSLPVPVLFGVTDMSPFINLADGGNTIFTAGIDGFQKIVQATNTENKMWKTQALVVPPDPKHPAPTPQPVKSYTTNLVAKNSDDSPASDATINLSAATRVAVYVNGLYTLLGPQPLSVTPDQAGVVTIVETIDNLNGTVITASMDNVTTTIDPMNETFGKLTPLQDQTTLASAPIYATTIAGGYLDTTTKTTLVKKGTDPALQQGLAQAMGNLVQSFPGNPSANPEIVSAGVSLISTHQHNTPALDGNFITHAIGDIYQAAKSALAAVEKVVSSVERDADGIVTFFIKIGEDAYKAILKGADAFIGAVQWLFHQVETGIEDVIKFVEELLAWDDIKRTQQILTNMTNVYLKDLVSSVQSTQTDFDKAISALETSINTIGTETDWSKLGDPAGKTAGGNSTNPMNHQTSQSQSMSNHYKNQASSLSESNATTSVQPSLVSKLMNTLDKEAQTLETAFDQFKALADNFSSMTISQILQQILKIFAEEILSSVQVVVDALFEVLISVADQLIDIMNAPITIPIISDILSDLGFPTVTFLELFSWIIAVSYTVVYKIAHEEDAPFVADAEFATLIAVNDWPDFVKAVDAQRKPLFIAGHATSGGLGILYSIAHAQKADAPGGRWGTAASVLSVLIPVLEGATKKVAPQDPLTDPLAKGISDAVSVLGILTSLMFTDTAQSQFKASSTKWKHLAISDGRAVSAVIKAIQTMPRIACTAVHLAELNDIAESGPRSAAIFDEVSSLCSYISTIAFAVAVNDPEPVTKDTAIAVLAVADIVGGGLRIVESTMLI